MGVRCKAAASFVATTSFAAVTGDRAGDRTGGTFGKIDSSRGAAGDGGESL